MRLAAALVALGLPAATEPLCSADPATLTCAPQPRRDDAGILSPGFHAWYDAPTTRYDHGILGDAVEWGALTFVLQGSAEHGPYLIVTHTLPETHVFEDIAPRFADLDADGVPEIIAVETDLARGASLAIYAVAGESLVKRAETPHIGRPHRWLAPLGAADLDGDGTIEIAYIDRPHLAKVLRILRYDPQGPSLTEVASASHVTNHRIGDTVLLGGLRSCDGRRPEIIAATGDWNRLAAFIWDGSRLTARDLGRNLPGAAADALACR